MVVSPLVPFTCFLLIVTLIPTLNAACNAGDEKVLLAFKNGDRDRSNILSDWGKPGSSCCTWKGITCQVDRVIAISLPATGLRGQIPPALGDLSQLQVLDLSNNVLDGPIPAELGNLVRLKTLDLGSSSTFSGTLDPKLGNLVNLEKLRISRAPITGSIPATFGNLKQLKSLDLSRNWLMNGDIPASLGQLRLLEELDLSRSSLRGRIPDSIGQLSSLVNLQLGGNSLSGSLPESMGLLSKLKELSLFSNMLTGRIPEGFARALTSLATLQLSGNAITGLPSNMANLRSLKAIVLDGNTLSFDTISGLATLPQLSYISLSGCGLKGNIPGWMRNIKLKPSSSSDTPVLMDFSANLITGDLPPEFGMLTELQNLDLHSNRLTGRVPDSIAKLRNLVSFNVGSNLLTGIPADLRGMGIATLDMSNNNLNFNELKGLTTLSRIESLVLSGSRIKGPIPEWFFSIRFTANQGVLNLESNEINGLIPASFARFSQLTELYLQNNQMSGQIPGSLSGMGNLQRLDLSRNRITGVIPAELQKLNQLQYFNVSSNQLQGKIPAGPPFSGMDTSLFADNPGLCGAPLPACK